MRLSLLALMCGVVLLLASAPFASAQQPFCANADNPTVSDDEAAEATMCLMNVARSQVGLDPVRRSLPLELAAARHSQDMLNRGYFNHFAPEPAPFGVDPGSRARAAGYTGFPFGENIAGAYATPRRVVAAWLSSPTGHCKNVIAISTTEQGVGVARLNGSIQMWTHMIGMSADAAAPVSRPDVEAICAQSPPTVANVDGGASPVVPSPAAPERPRSPPPPSGGEIPVVPRPNDGAGASAASCRPQLNAVRGKRVANRRIRLSFSSTCVRGAKLAVRIRGSYRHFSLSRGSVSVKSSLRLLKVGLYVEKRVVSVRTIRVRTQVR